MDPDKVDRFVFCRNETHLETPSLNLVPGADGDIGSLALLVEKSAREQLDLDISYIGLIEFAASAESYELLAVAY
jgi:hypothetical protein